MFTKHAEYQVIDSKYLCKTNDCDKVFLTMRGFKKHIKSKHGTQLTTFRTVCEVCKKHVKYLREHRNYFHNINKNVKRICEICSRIFTGRSVFLKHKAECKRCMYCDFKSDRLGRLKTHMYKCRYKVY